MRFTAVICSLGFLFAAVGCEPIADESGTDTVGTPDAAVVPSTPIPGASDSDAVMPTDTTGDATNDATNDAANPGSGAALDTNDPDTSDSAATAASADSDAPAPDNTAKNERDADGDTKTPLDQGSSEKDTEITQQIRQEVLEINNASVNARNVKIVTVDGKVTLRGPVETEVERDAIESIAVKAAGEGNVVNEIEVKAN